DGRPLDANNSPSRGDVRMSVGRPLGMSQITEGSAYSIGVGHSVIRSLPSSRRLAGLLQYPVADEDAKVRKPGVFRYPPLQLMEDPGAGELMAEVVAVLGRPPRQDE